MKTKSICDFDPKQLEAEFIKMNIPGFRARQIVHWVFTKGSKCFDEMINLPRELQKLLQVSYKIKPLNIIAKEISKLDGTTKVLYQLEDGNTVETVLMFYGVNKNPDRITVCVSTQVGCVMECSFCATGLGGYKRNLTKGEIVGQVLGFQQLLKAEEQSLRISNVVYMGMGEPLLNYDNVIASINMLNYKETFNISYRRMTISTCGLVPQIVRLAEENLPVTLAVSLHGATDEVRDRIMPVNKKYPLKNLLEACHYYFKMTGRKITFEYIMLDGVNDSLEDARMLAKLVRGTIANVNLIPFNKVNETDHMRSNKIKIRLFADQLAKLGIEVVIREEKGGDISAACGQLRQDRRINRGEL